MVHVQHCITKFYICPVVRRTIYVLQCVTLGVLCLTLRNFKCWIFRWLLEPICHQVIPVGFHWPEPPQHGQTTVRPVWLLCCTPAPPQHLQDPPTLPVVDGLHARSDATHGPTRFHDSSTHTPSISWLRLAGTVRNIAWTRPCSQRYQT